MNVLYIGDVSSPHMDRWVRHQPGSVSILGVFSWHKPCSHLLAKIHLNPFKLFHLLVFRRPNISFIHCHYIGQYSLVACIVSWFCRAPLVFTAWGSDVLIMGEKLRPYRYLKKLIISRARLVTTDSPRISQKLSSLAPYVKCIHCDFGIDKRFFVNQELATCSSSIAKAKHDQIKSFNPNLPIIVSVRNHETIYNIDKIIRGFYHMLMQGIPAYLIVLGSGSLSQYLLQLVSMLGISENVLFFGSFNRSDLRLVLSKASLAISLSSSDSGLSSTVAECMALKTIILSSSVGENPQWIRDGETGFLVDKYDSQTVGSAIVKSISISRDQKRQITEAAFRLIYDTHNAEICMSSCQRAIQDNLSLS